MSNGNDQTHCFDQLRLKGHIEVVKWIGVACLVLVSFSTPLFVIANMNRSINHPADYLLKMVVNQTALTTRLTPISGCLRSGLSWFNWWVSFAPEFQCCYFCESSCLFLS